MELFKLFGTLALLGVKDVKDDLSDVTEDARKSQSGIQQAFKKIGSAVVTYFAVDKIVDFGKACIDAASDVQAMTSQFTQVFGELEGQAASNLSGIADAAGIAENRMKASYTKIAAFAKTTGMDTASALSVADRAMIAVADSAAFYDRTLEETTESLQSFLKGNFENDAALGLSCTEVTRNAAAMKLFGDEYKNLTEQQKQLTLLQMVEDANALSGAMGQASRESETWTNQTGNLKQAWTDFKAIVGKNFLQPAITAVMKVTEVVQLASEKVPVLVQWFQDMYDRVSVHFPAIQQIFMNLWAAAQVVWETIGQPVFDMIMAVVGTLRDLYAQYMPEILAFVQQCFTDIGAFWESNLKPCLEAIGAFIQNVLAPVFHSVFKGTIEPLVWTVFDTIKNLWDGLLKPVFTGITDFLTGVFTLNFKKAFQGIVSIVKGIFGGLVSVVKAPINAVIGIVNSFIRGLNKIKVPSWVPGFGGKGINIPQIPKLAEGGILEKGQVGLLEGNGAEAVVPLDQNKAWISAVAQDMKAAGIGGQSDVVANYLRTLIDMLADYFPQVIAASGHDIVTNDGAIIARYAPMMNSELGRISTRKDRGR